MARARKPKAKRPAGPVVFVVQAGGRGVAEAVFVDRAAAEAHRRVLDRAARACVGPFDPGTPESQSSDGGSAFWAALTALGLDAPGKGQEWRDWWEAVCARTTADQRDVLWDALDAWHFYDVVEVPLEE
jgi:hypothetical protein